MLTLKNKETLSAWQTKKKTLTPLPTPVPVLPAATTATAVTQKAGVLLCLPLPYRTGASFEQLRGLLRAAEQVQGAIQMHFRQDVCGLDTD